MALQRFLLWDIIHGMHTRMKDAGYSFVNLDDCWAEKNRSSSGDLVPDKTRFSSGMTWLTDQIHSLGFKTGIYSDSGWFTCAGYPGSFENEARDAKTFQDWGFEFLKYDNCAIPYDDILRQNTMGKFERMADVIADLAKSSGKPPLIFNLCEWGWSQVWIWGKQLGQSWRIVDDLNASWPSITNTINFNSFITMATDFYGQNDLDYVDDLNASWPSITNTINFNSFITMATDFYGQNDLDYLQIIIHASGNGGLTLEESKSHFTAWALMRSPLFISTNLSALNQDQLMILKNEEIIVINQDPVVGTSISPFRWGVNPDWISDPLHPAGYWSGPTQNGTVVMLLNTLDEPTDMFFNLTESPWIRAGRQYSVRDLWSHTDNGTAVRNFTASAVPAHGVVALLLKDAGDEPALLEPKCAVWIQCTDQNGTRVGG
ncbi:glycoside hydrolase [Sanghuangporus baumii]|uniref:Alpha-galactosidase n=1 Tax=Sanghuangporus baumii TaxID=108892 RepID=A0A9Q5HXH9_SANBA|nr:glycoside hydrolase [Sanghuangporus baumii]